MLAWIKGDAAVLLQGERVALNLLQRMCGVATLTAEFVACPSFLVPCPRFVGTLGPSWMHLNFRLPSFDPFLGNLMAGIWLRSVKNFRIGDLVEIGEHFAIGQIFYNQDITKLLPKIKKILKSENLALAAYL